MCVPFRPNAIDAARYQTPCQRRLMLKCLASRELECLRRAPPLPFLQAPRRPLRCSVSLAGPSWTLREPVLLELAVERALAHPEDPRGLLAVALRQLEVA